MKVRTVVLADLVEAMRALDKLQDALTAAYVSSQGRRGPEGAAFEAVRAARDLSFEPQLEELIEKAITAISLSDE